MRLFVAGATGAIGRPLVRALLEAGHDVTGMTRAPARADSLRLLGADAVVADALDEDGVRTALTQAKPDVVIHQLTQIPKVIEPKRFYEEQMVMTNRLRTEGTRNLLVAAREAGARRMIAQSIAFAYAAEGGWVKDESAPLATSAPGAVGRAIAADAELEALVTADPGVEGVVLRYGYFYGPGTTYASDGDTAKTVRRRRLPIIRGAEGRFSFIHVEDAASATVAALEGPAVIFNVVDDEPATMREWLPAYAEALGAKQPRTVPVSLARLVAGRGLADMFMTVRGASNEKAKRELGWRPKYASWRRGFREALG